MKANEESKNGGKPADVATMFQDLLAQAVAVEDAGQRSTMLVRVAELSQQATERAKTELARRTQVEIDGNGRMIARSLEGLRQIGDFYSRGGEMIPKLYREKPGDCAVAHQMAGRLGIDTLTFMQKSYVVHGKPGLETPLQLAILHGSGKITGRVRYDIERDKSGAVVRCVAWCIDAATNEKVVGPEVTWQMVCDEGWNRDKKDRDGNIYKSKWNTLRELMFFYRAASFLIRRDYSDVSLGMLSREELEDMEAAPQAQVTTEWVRPATGSGLGNGTVVEPVYEAPVSESPKSEPPAPETLQPEYVNDVSEDARQETVQHTVPPSEAPVESTGNEKLDGYLTAISLAPAGGVDKIIQRAMDDKDLNDAQFEVIKTAGEKRRVNLQQQAPRPTGGDAARFVAQIKTMKTPTGIKNVVAKAEAANLSKQDLDAVYAAATAQNQVVNGGRPLLKSA